MDEESQEEREARIRDLFRKLDTKKKGTLDLPALRNGLANMDHPLANAENLLQEVLTMADINRDGKISFSGKPCRSLRRAKILRGLGLRGHSC